MKFANKTLFLGMIAIVLMISAAPVGIYSQETQIPDEQFSINLLTPDTNQNRIDWSTIIEQELPKGGITVDDNLVTGWGVIGPRTFGYDVSYESIGIPIHADGGFDLFFVGLSGSLNYDPIGSYSKSAYSPSGNNFAFYHNEELEGLMVDYTSELDPDARVPIAHDIQEILYEDQPYIPIINTAGQWAYVDETGFDEADLLMLGTTNYANSWANLDVSGSTELVYAHTYDLTEFMPFEIQSYIAAAYINPIFPGLFERDRDDPDYQFKPALAASVPEPSADGTTFVVDINPDAEFSNGNPVTADDVVNTYRMHMTDAASSNLAAGILPYISKNESITAVDSDTVQFVFDRPYFDAYTVMSLGIMDDAVIGTPDSPAAANYAFNDDPETYAVGAGPFEYDVIDDVAGNVRLSAVANWWGGSVALDTVAFNKHTAISAVEGIKAGNIHVIDAQTNFDQASLENEAGISLLTQPDFGTQFVTVNMKHPVIGTGVETPLGQADPSRAAEGARHVRKAISHLIPRQTIIDEILDGRGTVGTSLWPDVAHGYDSSLEPYEYSPTKAIQQMQLAGYFDSLDAALADVDGEGGDAPPDTSETDDTPILGVVPTALIAFFTALVALNLRRRR